MHIAIFGATGRTGARVMDRALKAGHEVRALVRDPSKLTTKSPRLTVIKGDVTDPKAVAEAIKGTEAVLSLFGQVTGSPPTLQTDGTQAIVNAMKEQGVNRIVTLSGGGLHDENDRPKTADKVIRFLLKTLSGHVLKDAEGHLRVLKESELAWTVVRAPRLTEHPGAGSYRVGWVGVGTGTQISRDDLADFILTQFDDTKFVHQMPFLSA